tara:strand:- start:113 stop:958 length:846 start_codon:yes stop_codon:yes gene_type:complete
MKKINSNVCKVCGGKLIDFIDHTAKCSNCGILLFYPYPNDNDILSAFMNEKDNYEWYANSFEKKIKGFAEIITFAVEDETQRNYKVLDYGGASGQFALIFKSFFPKSNVYITDINDRSLFEEYKPLNNQIKYKEFISDDNKFDFIFLNDVYEHVEDPIELISLLEKKLEDNGKIFIDTPRQFWIYPLFKFFNSNLYKKILKGTVSRAHLQIWTDHSFQLSLNNTNLKISKKKYFTELTQDTEYYLRGMGIRNKLLKKIILFFTAIFLFSFKNKIIAILSKK